MCCWADCCPAGGDQVRPPCPWAGALCALLTCAELCCLWTRFCSTWTRGGQAERCPHLERVGAGVRDEDSVCWTRLFFSLGCTGCKQAGQLKTTGSEDPAAAKPGSFLLLPKQHNSRWQLRLPQFLGRPTSGHPEHSRLCICRHGQRVECSQALRQSLNLGEHPVLDCPRQLNGAQPFIK